MSVDRSFVSYVNFDVPKEDAEGLVEEGPSLLKGEMIASQCDKVILYTAFSDSRRGFLGKLYCTNFRLSFVPMGRQDQKQEGFQRSRYLNDEYDIPLGLINEVTYSIAPDGRKFKTMQAPVSSLELVSAVKLFCKDFRVLTFDFKVSQFAVQLLNQTYHFSFPQKSEVLLSLSLQENSYRDSIPNFNVREDWEWELRRTRAEVHGWRVSMVNSGFRLANTYPEFVVVPQNLLDHAILTNSDNWIKRRFPVWSWSSPDGAAIVRSSDLNTDAKRSSQQLNEMLETVKQCNPSGQAQTIRVDIPLQKIGESFSGLSRLCSRDSSTQCWLEDDGWKTSLERNEWLDLVRRTLTLVHQLTQALSNRHSVLLIEESNTDLNCIVSSLAQICMDPYFRTRDGFSLLLKKEWMAMGHPFGKRLHCLTAASRSGSVTTPVFLLYLDCVSQLVKRYPGEFEFSHYFLVALWDLALGGSTGSFLVNSMRERTSMTNRFSSAWPLELHFTNEYLSLFRNPVYSGRKDADASELLRVRPRNRLVPPHRAPELDFWDECYLRWCPPAQIASGGYIQGFMECLTISEDIKRLRREKEMLLSEKRVSIRGGFSPTSATHFSSGYPYSSATNPFPEFGSSAPNVSEQLPKTPKTGKEARNSVADFRVQSSFRYVDPHDISSYRAKKPLRPPPGSPKLKRAMKSTMI